MTKITIERETLELAASLIQPLTGKGDREVYDALRAALAQKAEPPSMPQGKSLALLDLDSVEHMQGGANGPTIRLRGFINAQTGPTAPQPPIDNAFVAEGCEQFSPPSEPAPVPCCGKYETCSHACTPRGKWLGRREAERAALAAQPVALQPPIDNAFVAPDCEQFSSNQSDASRLLEILGVALDECRRLAAAQPAPAAVPPGYALVPIEPTPGIITTGTVALMKASDSDLDATREEIAATYRAMIAAAGDKP